MSHAEAIEASTAAAAPVTLAPSAPPAHQHRESQPKLLSPLLVWAVVFCDIGTSVYYVPGILYSQVGPLAPLFVIGTTIGFLLLASKYVEICWRNPEGGGVVTVATKAFNPRWGCFGGMLITVDYFLTSAISSVSGMHYLASLFGALDAHIIGLSVAALIFLAVDQHDRHPRERDHLAGDGDRGADRSTSSWSASPAGTSVRRHWELIVHHLTLGSTLTPTTFLVGFAGAWLAFSGLESISQLSPAMREPLRRSASRGMYLVVASMLVTAPLLTLFSVALLPEAVKAAGTERFISELGHDVGRAAGEDRGRDDRVGAAALRRQHGDHRRLPRLPRAGAGGLLPRVHHRAQPPLRHAALGRSSSPRSCRWWSSSPPPATSPSSARCTPSACSARSC